MSIDYRGTPRWGAVENIYETPILMLLRVFFAYLYRVVMVTVVVNITIGWDARKQRYVATHCGNDKISVEVNMVLIKQNCLSLRILFSCSVFSCVCDIASVFLFTIIFRWFSWFFIICKHWETVLCFYVEKTTIVIRSLHPNLIYGQNVLYQQDELVASTVKLIALHLWREQDIV